MQLKQTIAVPSELVAALVEIHSDLGYIIENGLDMDTYDSIELLYNRAGALLAQLAAEQDKASA